jgi:hypothetical protein
MDLPSESEQSRQHQRTEQKEAETMIVVSSGGNILPPPPPLMDRADSNPHSERGSDSDEIMFVRESNGLAEGGHHSGKQRVGYEAESMDGGDAETSYFQDKLPYASSPPPPPSTPLRRRPGAITPLKRKMEVDDSPDANSPALSRLAKRMARSSMSSPQVPHITDVAMADGFSKDRYTGGDEMWEDEQDQWGDEAMLEWNAPSNASQGAQDRTFESATAAHFLPPQSPQAMDLDWTMDGNNEDTVERPDANKAKRPDQVLVSQKSRIVASPEQESASDEPSASPRPDPAVDRIQALLDRGMPDYASWDLPSLQVCPHRALRDSVTDLRVRPPLRNLASNQARSPKP